MSDNARDTPKPLRLTIEFTSQEQTEPVNLAIRQLEAVFDWMELPGNRHLIEKDAVLTACAGFHPDWRYDPKTRALRTFEHGGKVWESWEALDFSPEGEHTAFHARLANLRGFPAWLDFGKDDYRKAALCITAQLACYEGNRLLDALKQKPLNDGDVWRRLYWFTRFFRAMQRIGYGITPGEWAKRERAAQKTRTWKRAAWAYLNERRGRNAQVTDRQAAIAFVRSQSPGVSAKTVQDYFTERRKKTVGRAAPDKRK